MLCRESEPDLVSEFVNLRPRGSVQLDIGLCPCRHSGESSPERSRSSLQIPSRKRVSIMLDDELLRNGYPSLLILGNNQDYEKPVKSFLKKSLGDVLDTGDNRAKMEIISNCSDDSLVDTSDSYEMVEYGLSPLEMKALKQSRRKSCLCWHPDVVFNDKTDSESEDLFPQDFMSRLDEYYIGSEVSKLTMLINALTYSISASLPC